MEVAEEKGPDRYLISKLSDKIRWLGTSQIETRPARCLVLRRHYLQFFLAIHLPSETSFEVGTAVLELAEPCLQFRFTPAIDHRSISS